MRDPFNATVVRRAPESGTTARCPLKGEDSCNTKSCPRCGGRVNHHVSLADGRGLRYVCDRCNLWLWPWPHQVPSQ